MSLLDHREIEALSIPGHPAKARVWRRSDGLICLATGSSGRPATFTIAQFRVLLAQGELVVQGAEHRTGKQ